MYKILTKLHTESPSIYRYHMITDDKGNLCEFAASTLDEVELEAIKILEKVGCYDLRIVEEQPYYIDLNYDEDPDFDEKQIKNEALSMLNYMGWGDLKISDNKPFSIDLIWGYKPEEPIPTYTLTILLDGEQVEEITDIEEGGTRSFSITLPEECDAFHLIIDGVELKGIPKWVEYQWLTENTGILTFKGITDDHTIEIIIDKDIIK